MPIAGLLLVVVLLAACKLGRSGLGGNDADTRPPPPDGDSDSDVDLPPLPDSGPDGDADADRPDATGDTDRTDSSEEEQDSDFVDAESDSSDVHEADEISDLDEDDSITDTEEEDGDAETDVDRDGDGGIILLPYIPSPYFPPDGAIVSGIRGQPPFDRPFVSWNSLSERGIDTYDVCHAPNGSPLLDGYDCSGTQFSVSSYFTTLDGLTSDSVSWVVRSRSVDIFSEWSAPQSVTMSEDPFGLYLPLDRIRPSDVSIPSNPVEAPIEFPPVITSGWICNETSMGIVNGNALCFEGTHYLSVSGDGLQPAHLHLEMVFNITSSDPLTRLQGLLDTQGCSTGCGLRVYFSRRTDEVMVSAGTAEGEVLVFAGHPISAARNAWMYLFVDLPPAPEQPTARVFNLEDGTSSGEIVGSLTGGFIPSGERLTIGAFRTSTGGVDYIFRGAISFVTISDGDLEIDPEVNLTSNICSYAIVYPSPEFCVPPPAP